MKVAVVSIMKNEAKHVERWADSCRDADYRYLLDTGSTDDSVALAQACGVTVLHAKIDPWHFGRARNTLLDQLPDDVDWIVNLDVDEVFGKGWRAALEALPNDGSVNRPRYLYTWNWESKVTRNGVVDVEATIAEGKPGLQYLGDKITRRFSHRWVNAVHEVNVNQKGHAELQCHSDLRIYHFADDTKSRGHYLPLLLQDLEENPENDRNTYYAARELMYHGRTEESVKLFKRHITMPTSWWAPERGYSMRYIAKQVPEEREWWLLRGCAEYPWGREIWLDLAQHYHDERNWTGCYWAAWRCLQVTDRGNLYLTEPRSWGWAPHDLFAIAAYRLGFYEQAIHQGSLALEHAPDDQRLRDNMFFYMHAQSKVTVVIPTKSNLDGLVRAVVACKKSPKVKRIVVVADGEKAWDSLSALPPSVLKLMVPEGTGIHAMWNMGMEVADGHVLFLNDDVRLGDGAIDRMCESLDRHLDYGLVCPQYHQQAGAHAQYSTDKDVFTDTTCRGRYDGTGGMAGFCMMLDSHLAEEWRFDERMKWWYGDDDLVAHVVGKGLRATIISGARCEHAHSKTVDNDPPKGFAILVERDRKIYEQKRGIGA